MSQNLHSTAFVRLEKKEKTTKDKMPYLSLFLKLMDDSEMLKNDSINENSLCIN